MDSFPLSSTKENTCLSLPNPGLRLSSQESFGALLICTRAPGQGQDRLDPKKPSKHTHTSKFASYNKCLKRPLNPWDSFPLSPNLISMHPPHPRLSIEMLPLHLPFPPPVELKAHWFVDFCSFVCRRPSVNGTCRVQCQDFWHGRLRSCSGHLSLPCLPSALWH